MWENSATRKSFSSCSIFTFFITIISKFMIRSSRRTSGLSNCNRMSEITIFREEIISQSIFNNFFSSFINFFSHTSFLSEFSKNSLLEKNILIFCTFKTFFFIFRSSIHFCLNNLTCINSINIIFFKFNDTSKEIIIVNHFSSLCTLMFIVIFEWVHQSFEFSMFRFIFSKIYFI